MGLLLLLSTLLTAPVEAGGRIEVRAAVHPDHARLVLDWASSVTVERRTIDDGLMLRFDRSFEADLAAAAVRLASHVAALTASEGGKELRSGVVLGHFRQFEPDLVVLDFMQASARPEPGEGAVATRIGHHMTATRAWCSILVRRSSKSSLRMGRPAS